MKYVCESCNNVFLDQTNKRRFCSKICQGIYLKKVSALKIENGEKVDIRTIKIYLIEKRGHKCEICFNTEWCGQSIPLIIDHIDGNSQNDTLDNLRLVCGNCDMQLPTYKSKNKGKGRFFRRKRYREGKSY